ncbi:MAG: hypothetical protein KGL39_03825 [Patescibacteria group bacterium]|nr:hypothetical protein [Patescibacteria group bacterium]
MAESDLLRGEIILGAFFILAVIGAGTVVAFVLDHTIMRLIDRAAAAAKRRLALRSGAAPAREERRKGERRVDHKRDAWFPGRREPDNDRRTTDGGK